MSISGFDPSMLAEEIIEEDIDEEDDALFPGDSNNKETGAAIVTPSATKTSTKQEDRKKSISGSAIYV